MIPSSYLHRLSNSRIGDCRIESPSWLKLWRCVKGCLADRLKFIQINRVDNAWQFWKVGRNSDQSLFKGNDWCFKMVEFHLVIIYWKENSITIQIIPPWVQCTFHAWPWALGCRAEGKSARDRRWPRPRLWRWTDRGHAARQRGLASLPERPAGRVGRSARKSTKQHTFEDRLCNRKF